METHLVFYVDFLGVKQLIRNTPTEPEHVERVNSFTKLLHYVASLRGDLRLIERPLESGRQFIVQPEISHLLGPHCDQLCDGNFEEHGAGMSLLLVFS